MIVVGIAVLVMSHNVPERPIDGVDRVVGALGFILIIAGAHAIYATA
jgi:hypothetical protein